MGQCFKTGDAEWISKSEVVCQLTEENVSTERDESSLTVRIVTEQGQYKRDRKSALFLGVNYAVFDNSEETRENKDEGVKVKKGEPWLKANLKLQLQRFVCNKSGAAVILCK